MKLTDFLDQWTVNTKENLERTSLIQLDARLAEHQTNLAKTALDLATCRSQLEVAEDRAHEARELLALLQRSIELCKNPLLDALSNARCG